MHEVLLGGRSVAVTHIKTEQTENGEHPAIPPECCGLRRTDPDRNSARRQRSRRPRLGGSRRLRTSARIQDMDGELGGLNTRRLISTRSSS